MSLQPPRDESLNGLLQGYRIYYRELEYEAGSGTEAKTLKSPIALRAELTGETVPSVLARGARVPGDPRHLLSAHHGGKCRGGG